MDFDVIVGSREYCRPLQTREREQERRDLRTTIVDKTGLATAQVTHLSDRGCQLCLSKPLARRQYLTLSVLGRRGRSFADRFGNGEVDGESDGRCRIPFDLSR